jgi:uncharacterized protein (DUF433 family)
MNYQDVIIRNSDILAGKPIIKGTRISIELILKKMSEGATIEDLLKGYPHLEAYQIYAVLAYSSAVISNEEILDLV